MDYALLKAELFSNVASFFAPRVRTAGTSEFTLDEIADAVWAYPIGDSTAGLVLAMLYEESNQARKMLTNKAVISSNGLSVALYEDDNTTLFRSFTISSDKKSRVPA